MGTRTERPAQYAEYNCAYVYSSVYYYKCVAIGKVRGCVIKQDKTFSKTLLIQGVSEALLLAVGIVVWPRKTVN